jgi:hypothetical protein
MQTEIQHQLPNGKNRSIWAIAITVIIALILSYVIIYQISEYGVALFILLPIFMGMGSSVIKGYKASITTKEARRVAFQSLLYYGLVLFVFAMEGLICIVMAAPFALLLVWLGSYLGYLIINHKQQQSINAVVGLIALIPLFAFAERTITPPVKPVTSSVIIDAPIEVVWDNVIAFPRLEEPSDLIFKAGISNPISSKIEGNGVGAVRYCQFNTGDFVEPITTWEENKLLAFDVEEQPVPMRELSFWDVDSPHLHDYFVSKRGQFELNQLEDGKVALIGTTWYYHDIKPDAYWRLWSNYIIHKIHHRVLDHIKVVSESQSPDLQ